MNQPVFSRMASAVALVLLQSACSTAPVVPPTPLAATPDAFKEAGPPRVGIDSAAMAARGAWWLAFDDPVLSDLVTRAEAGNTSLQLAAARLKQSQAILRSVSSQWFPELGVRAGTSRATWTPGTAPAPGDALTNLQIGATASWQPDLFGKISKAVTASRLDEQSSEELLLSARLLVQAQVAQAYFALRALDSERALVHDTVGAYRDTLKLTEGLYKAGQVAELDFARVRAEVAATESEALALDEQRLQVEHALAVLVGEVPADFGLAEGSWRDAPPSIPAGIPSVVLARRPDVAAAEKAMESAEARVGVAKTAWFPDVALTANAGYASTDMSDLFKWSARAWGIGALLSLPVFDGGRRSAALESANAQWDAAAAQYRDSVLNAFRDVEDQLAALRLLGQRARSQSEAVDAASLATSLTTSRYRNGYVSQLELLDARRTELSNRRVALHIRSAQFQATVGLIQSLGGGWDTPAKPAG